MSTQFISSASAGVQTQHGSQLVENVAQGVIALGIAALSIGNAIASDDLLGRNVAFDFQSASTWEGRLDFDQTSRPFVPSGAYSFETGELVIENQSQGAIYAGFESSSYGNARASDDILGRNVVFDFSAVQPADLALHFNFAGPYVLRPVPWVDTTFGLQDVDAPWTIAPSGWQSTKLGNSRASDDILGRNVVFDLSLVQPASLALHFNFAGPDVLAGTGLASQLFGTQLVENVAQGAQLRGIDSAQLGNSITSADVSGRFVDFNLTVTSTPNPPIQFAFGGNNRTARFDVGLDATLYGDQYIWVVPIIEPAGWDSTEYGIGINTIWLPYPIGFDSLYFGRNGVHFPGYVLPHDWDSAEFGLPDVPEIVFSGIRSTDWGQAEVTITAAPVTQTAAVEEGFDSSAFGPDKPSEDEAWVFAISNYWRVLPDVGNVLLASFSSETLVGASPQVIFTPFDNGSLEMGEPPRVGREIEIVMSPVPAFSRFGLALIDHARIFPTMFDSLELYKPAIHNTARALVFDGIQGRLGVPQLAFNQFVDVFHDCGPLRDRCGHEFGEYTWVRNRNQTIRPNPLSSFRAAYFPYHIGLRGKGYQMEGFVSHEFNQRWEPMHLIDFRVRHYTVGDLDSFESTAWHRVKNDARLLAPEGISSGGMGLPKAERMLQRVHMWGISSLQVEVVERVSDGTQSTHVEHSIREENHGEPFVSYGARSLEVSGWDSFFWVRPVVWERPPHKVTPWWPQDVTQDRMLIGRAQVKNFNPQAFIYGRDMLSVTDDAAWVSFYERSVATDSIEYGAVFGRPRIEDADKVYDFQGFELAKFSEGATVWPDPPTTYLPLPQPVFFLGWMSFDDGDWELLESVVQPEGFEATLQGGETSIYANSIIFTTAHNPQHGWTTFTWEHQVFGGEDVLEVAEYDHDEPRPDGPATAYGKPRVSPHTIWATNDAPQQASLNHGGTSWCDVDKFCPPATHPFHSDSIGSAKTGPWFGVTKVYLHADIVVDVLCGNLRRCTRNFFSPGQTEITFGTNIFEPEGFHFFRTGYPTIGGSSIKEVKFRDGLDSFESEKQHDDDEEIYSDGHIVTDNGPRYADVHGLGSLEFSDSHAENLHRPVYPAGTEMTLYDPMSYYPFPVAPVIYHHPRGPSGVVGQELTEFGFATDDLHISHSPRWLYTIGNVTFESEWTEFNTWLRIYNLDTLAFSFAFNDMFDSGQAHVQGSIARIAPYGICPVCASPGFEVTHGVI